MGLVGPRALRLGYWSIAPRAAIGSINGYSKGLKPGTRHFRRACHRWDWVPICNPHATIFPGDVLLINGFTLAQFLTSKVKTRGLWLDGYDGLELVDVISELGKKYHPIGSIAWRLMPRSSTRILVPPDCVVKPGDLSIKNNSGMYGTRIRKMAANPELKQDRSCFRYDAMGSGIPVADVWNGGWRVWRSYYEFMKDAHDSPLDNQRFRLTGNPIFSKQLPLP